MLVNNAKRIILLLIAVWVVGSLYVYLLLDSDDDRAWRERTASKEITTTTRLPADVNSFEKDITELERKVDVLERRLVDEKSLRATLLNKHVLLEKQVFEAEHVKIERVFNRRQRTSRPQIDTAKRRRSTTMKHTIASTTSRSVIRFSTDKVTKRGHGPNMSVEHKLCGLTTPACRLQRESFVTYTPGGGFNNQRQSLERAVQLAALLNRTLVLRDVRIVRTHNPENTDRLFEDGRLFFDMDVMRSNGFRVIYERDLKTQHRDVWKAKEMILGVFKDGRVWTESMPCDYESNPILSLQGGVVEKASVVPILERYGCDNRVFLEFGVTGMNSHWRTSAYWRQFAYEHVQLPLSIQMHAAHIVQRLGGKEKFSCIHYRQGDKLRVSPKEYNYTAQMLVSIMEHYEYLNEDEPIYIATDLRDGELHKLDAFYKQYGKDRVFTARSFDDYLSNIDIPTNDYLGGIEVKVCVEARLFLQSSSTFSMSIINERHHTTAITDAETDTTRNFRITRLTRDWRRKWSL